MEKRIIFIPLLFMPLIHSLVGAENGRTEEEAVERMNLQTAVFPQEKVHLHTDRAAFLKGDTIRFRAYVVNAGTHRPNTSSRYVYVELISPYNHVESRVKIRPTNGVYSGYIPLGEGLADGEYVIRAYTHFMLNLEDDCLFRKKVEVYDPYFLFADTHMDFSFSGNRNQNVQATLWMQEKESGERFRPVMPRIFVNHPFDPVDWKNLKYNARDSTVTVWFQLPEETGRQNVMTVDFDKYRKYVPVTPPDETFDVQFFPEGGYLVAGAVNTVGFKALGATGKARMVSGTVHEETGAEVASLESFWNGMGSFSLFAEAGKSYYALCTDDNGKTVRVELPAVEPDAYGIRVTRANGSIHLSLLGTEGNREDLYLYIHNRGRTVLSIPWERKTVVMDEKDYPAGLMHALVLNDSMRVLNERLFFCYGMRETETTVAIAGNPGTRSLVRMGIDVLDGSGRPASGSFSVSVTDDLDIPADTLYNIASTLLLNSELRGFVEEPGRYMGDDPPAREALDALLLTQGWRRYDLPAVLAGRYTELTYPLEVGQEISGTTEKIIKKTSMDGLSVDMYVPSPLYIAQTESDEEGRFYLNGFEFPENTTIYLQTLTKKGKKGVRLTVDTMVFPAVELPFVFSGERSGKKTEDPLLVNMKEKNDRMYIDEYGMRMIDLAKVTIVGTKWPEHWMTFGRWAKRSFDSEKLERMDVTTMRDLLLSMNFLDIREGNQIWFEGVKMYEGPARVIIDNIAVDQDFMWTLPVDEIELIEVAFNHELEPLYGRGIPMDMTEDTPIHPEALLKSTPGGTINIITKNGFYPQKYKKTTKVNYKVIQPLGYQKPVEFYSPKYETAEQKANNKSDMRSTIHWAPANRTDGNGHTEVEFYTADTPSSYSVVIEGVTDDGRIIYHTDKFTVE